MAERLTEIALNVPCPVCGAKQGFPCKRPRSRQGPHEERLTAAQRRHAKIVEELAALKEHNNG